MEDPPLAGVGDFRFAMRLRLEPVSPANAADLWRVHSDDEVLPWYGQREAEPRAGGAVASFMGDPWRFHGVHKWIPYDRISGEVAGRGGLSRTPVDDDWGQTYTFPAEPWVRVAHEIRCSFVAHANWLDGGRSTGDTGPTQDVPQWC